MIGRLWRALLAWADRGLEAGPHLIVGMSVGAALFVLRFLVAWPLALLAVLSVAFLGRFTRVIGRQKNEGWHLEVVAGAMAVEWVYLMLMHRP